MKKLPSKVQLSFLAPLKRAIPSVLMQGMMLFTLLKLIRQINSTSRGLITLQKTGDNALWQYRKFDDDVCTLTVFYEKGGRGNQYYKMEKTCNLAQAKQSIQNDFKRITFPVGEHLTWKEQGIQYDGFVIYRYGCDKGPLKENQDVCKQKMLLLLPDGNLRVYNVSLLSRFRESMKRTVQSSVGSVIIPAASVVAAGVATFYGLPSMGFISAMVGSTTSTAVVAAGSAAAYAPAPATLSTVGTTIASALGLAAGKYISNYVTMFEPSNKDFPLNVWVVLYNVNDQIHDQIIAWNIVTGEVIDTRFEEFPLTEGKWDSRNTQSQIAVINDIKTKLHRITDPRKRIYAINKLNEYLKKLQSEESAGFTTRDAVIEQIESAIRGASQRNQINNIFISEDEHLIINESEYTPVEEVGNLYIPISR